MTHPGENIGFCVTGSKRNNVNYHSNHTPIYRSKIPDSNVMKFQSDRAKGKSPSLKSANIPQTFSEAAREWLKVQIKDKTEGYLKTIHYRLNKYILPMLGDFPLKNITSGNILQICRRVEDSGHDETAKRVKTIIGQVYRFAIAAGWTDTDPTPRFLVGSGLVSTKHYATLIKTAEKMKMKRRQIIPLSTQARAILDELRPLTGSGKWLFPSPRNDGRCMSENGVRSALRASFTKE